MRLQASLGIFQKAVKNSFSKKDLLALVSVKRNSTAEVIPGTLQTYLLTGRFLSVFHS